MGYRRVRLMNEDAKTFEDCWQHTDAGIEVGFVDDEGMPVVTPANYSVMFRDQTGPGEPVPEYAGPDLNSGPAQP